MAEAAFIQRLLALPSHACAPQDADFQHIKAAQRVLGYAEECLRKDINADIFAISDATVTMGLWRSTTSPAPVNPFRQLPSELRTEILSHVGTSPIAGIIAERTQFYAGTVERPISDITQAGRKIFWKDTVQTPVEAILNERATQAIHACLAASGVQVSPQKGV